VFQVITVTWNNLLPQLGWTNTSLLAASKHLLEAAASQLQQQPRKRMPGGFKAEQRLQRLNESPAVADMFQEAERHLSRSEDNVMDAQFKVFVPKGGPRIMREVWQDAGMSEEDINLFYTGNNKALFHRFASTSFLTVATFSLLFPCASNNLDIQALNLLVLRVTEYGQKQYISRNFCRIRAF
jgi:hypothetical protein